MSVCGALKKKKNISKGDGESASSLHYNNRVCPSVRVVSVKGGGRAPPSDLHFLFQDFKRLGKLPLFSNT